MTGCGKRIDWDSRDWGYFWRGYTASVQDKPDASRNLHLAWEKDMQGWGRTNFCGSSFQEIGWQYIYCRTCILKSGLRW